MIEILVVSFFSGLYTSCWGAYKDSPYEGWKTHVFPRSILFSLFFAIFFSIPYFRVNLKTFSMFEVFFFIMGIERSFSEVYKGCFRWWKKENTEIFLIPQHLTILGKKIPSITSACLGMISIIGMLVCFRAPWYISSLPSFLITSVLTGLVIAAFGSNKDAPFEGFSKYKFFRSAIVLGVCFPSFYFLNQKSEIQVAVLTTMFGGLERFLIEFYKSYIQKSRPGKFKDRNPSLKGTDLLI